MKFIKKEKGVIKEKKFKIKNLFKSRVFFFILGIFLTSVIGVSAASVLYSKDVTYDNSSSGLSSTNLQDALDELYEQVGSGEASVTCDDNNNCTVTCKQGNPTMTSNGYICSTTTDVTCSDGQFFFPTENGYKCAAAIAFGGTAVIPAEVGDGLYIDNIIYGRYYYRGANPNNYITFNNETWRIISIEPDGTIKIKKDVRISNGRAWDSSNRTTGTYCSNPYSCNVWGSSSTMLNVLGVNVASMPRVYSGTLYELPTAEATLNTYLNTTYYDSLNSEAKSKIVSHNFNVGVVNIEKGQTIDVDVQQEKQYQWKGKVALFSAIDYVRATTNNSCTGVYSYINDSNCYGSSSTDNWMYYRMNSWTLSPYSDSSNSYNILCACGYNNGGGLCSKSAGSTPPGDSSAINTFPVVFLSSDIKLTGKGTSSDPYVLSG